MDDTNRLVNLSAVQAHLSLSAPQVAALVRSGDLQVLQILGEVRVESAAVDRLIATARERAASCEPPPLASTGDDDPVSAHSVSAGSASAAPMPPAAPTVDELLERSGRPPDGRDRRLIAQQRRVLILVGQGLPNDQVAQRLSLEVSTVKSHVARLLRRLDLPDRGRLIAYAWREGLLRSTFPPRLQPEGGSRREADATAGAHREVPTAGGRRTVPD